MVCHIGWDLINVYKYLKAVCQGDSQTLLTVTQRQDEQWTGSEIEEVPSEHHETFFFFFATNMNKN